MAMPCNAAVLGNMPSQDTFHVVVVVCMLREGEREREREGEGERKREGGREWEKREWGKRERKREKVRQGAIQVYYKLR